MTRKFWSWVHLLCTPGGGSLGDLRKPLFRERAPRGCDPTGKYHMILKVSFFFSFPSFEVHHQRCSRFTGVRQSKCTFLHSCRFVIFCPRVVWIGKYYMIMKVASVLESENLLCPVREQARGAIRLVKHI